MQHTFYIIDYRSPGSVSIGRTVDPSLVAGVLQHGELKTVIEAKRKQFEAKREANRAKREEFLMGKL